MPLKTLTVSLLLGGLSMAAIAATDEASVGAIGEGRHPSSGVDFVEADFPFFSSVLDERASLPGLPSGNLTPRGLLLNLGHDTWACFDTELLRMAAFWTGSGVTPVSMAQGSYRVAGAKATEGQEHLPHASGSVWFANGIYPGWQTGERLSLTDPRDPGPDAREVGRGPLPAADGRFQAIEILGAGAILRYTVAGADVTEQVTSHVGDGGSVIQRAFRLDHVTKPLKLILGRPPAKDSERLSVDVQFSPASGQPTAARVREDLEDGFWVVRVSPSEKPVEFRVAIGTARSVETWESTIGSLPVKSSSQRWPQSIVTHANLSTRSDAYVVDNIPIPLNNPWKRNVRLADLAFFKDGRAAAVTFDGDVWMISNLRDDLSAVSWHRFASGLHEPLGLCIRGEDLFVFDRNGIWRLRDIDGDGEADAHELFSNAFTQTAETREYAQGIKAAPDGSFIIAKAGIEFTSRGKHNGTVLRISPDGASASVLAYGLRSPFIGVHPKTGLITASDQQGYYVPATPLHIIRDGMFYGFLPSIVPKEAYPESIATPLTWIPHAINASGASQVWLTDARMGPLNDGLIHLGYYRPEIFAVLTHSRSSSLQAAVVSVTHDLEFAPLGGAVNPVDGQLYVVGFQIFGTTAKQISGMARLRYTGAPSTLPREVVAMDHGILLRFDVALDPREAVRPENFSPERWNYVRTANYGSPHFKLDGSKGQDSLTPSRVYLSKDGKSIFVGIPEMKPVMQMRLGWALTTREGTSFTQNAYLTPHMLPHFVPAAEGFESFTVDLQPRAPQSTPSAAPITVAEGRRVSELMGCVACHSNDGSTLGKVGPTWKGVFGSSRQFADGSTAVADEAYLRQSIREPSAKIILGFEKSDTGMPSYDGVISDAQIESLILYLKTLH